MDAMVATSGTTADTLRGMRKTGRRLVLSTGIVTDRPIIKNSEYSKHFVTAC